MAYFPPADGPWATLDPAAAGWRPDALEAVLTFAGDTGSTAVTIVQGGRIVAERYWRNATADLPCDVASVQKSVTSLLVGIAQAAGRLQLEDPVSRWLVPGWSRADPSRESAVTLHHLLSMTTGLDTDLRYQAPPGQRWYYNTPAYSRLHEVLASATGLSLNSYSRQALFRPIGMAGAAWTDRLARRRERAPQAAQVGLRTTARDLARLGLLVLAEGSWAGRPVVDAGYLRTALTSSQTDNPSFGLLWWLNGKPSYRLPRMDPPSIPGPIVPTAPSDMVAALGALDQKLYVVRSLDLVVTRQGRTAGAVSGGDLSFDTAWWRALAAAAPHR